MKQGHSNGKLKQFVYIDSSEEEYDVKEQLPTQLPSRRPNTAKPSINRECKTLEHCNKDTPEYNEELKAIVHTEIDKLQHGQALLIHPNDHTLQHNIQMRKEKYAYFVKQMEINEKYQAIMNEKVRKLKKENKRKTELGMRKREEIEMKDEENLLRKYVIEKRGREEKVLKNVKKTVHALGVERKTLITAKAKIQIEIERTKTSHKIHDKGSRQRDELQELREQYEQIQKEKRMNKIDEQKAVREMEKQISQRREELKDKLLLKRDFII